MLLARRLGGVFVSEDRDARVLAAGELGANRVVGTPVLPARGVRTGLLGPEGAWQIYRAMLAAGRRPGRLKPDWFGRCGEHADGASVGGAVWTSGPPVGGGRSRGSKG
jgi:hypothetical protein